MPDAHARDLDREDIELAAQYLGLNGSNAEVARRAIQKFAELERQRQALEEVRAAEFDDEAVDALIDALERGLDEATSVDEPQQTAEAIVSYLRESPMDVRASVAEEEIARGVHEGGRRLLADLESADAFDTGTDLS